MLPYPPARPRRQRPWLRYSATSRPAEWTLGRAVVGALLVTATTALPASPTVAEGDLGIHFTDVTDAAGLIYEHGLGDLPFEDASLVSGGVAVGDYDGDGLVDLFVVRGGLGPPILWRNDGGGGFDDVTLGSGLEIDDPRVTAPLFADFSGDGWLDLVLGGLADAPLRFFRNRQGIDFVEVTEDSGTFSSRHNFSSTMADYDRDGDLDLFVAHWSPDGGGANHLWRNDGDLFSPVDFRVGIAFVYQTIDWTFTPNFTDLDGDGWPELLLASDFGTSRVFRNERGRRLHLDTRTLFSDENGMGAALGDYDNDGDIDWFVTSIWDPDGTPEGNWGVTGNRLYRNRGDGSFDEVSEAAGVRQGFWGWGACFGDFDHDGWLDIFHTNGFQAPDAGQFVANPVRFFHNRGDGSFDERSASLGLDDTGLGRGVACFDYDRDGDLDLFVANHSGPPRLYRNDTTHGRHWLSVRLRDDGSQGGSNRHGIGARLTLTTDGMNQVREIRCGSNYLSQQPAEAHFGLADSQRVDRLHILWPDGSEQVLEDLAVDQQLVIDRSGPPPTDIPLLSPWGLALFGLLSIAVGLGALRRRATLGAKKRG